MAQYAQHFNPRQTPQSEQADSRQAANSAGGFSFQITPWQRLERWLVLGAEGGTYYAGERELTRDNAKTIQECLKLDARKTVETIVAVSDGGRAPKNDPAVFALALAAADPSAETRALALAALPKVCRIGTHLFQFAEAVNAFRGWGRGLRRAVGEWYASRSAEQVAYQVAKYGQRNGWSHRDLLRLAHPDVSPEHAAVFRYVVSGANGLGEREIKPPKGSETVRKYPALGDLPAFLEAFEELKHADEKRTIALIREHGFTHEMIDTRHKQSASVWEALLEKMPPTAMIRNLAKMTEVGLIKPMASCVSTVAERLVDEAALKKARVHPIQILSALMVYRQGHGERGKLRWDPVPRIVDALDAGFYAAFGAVQPTGKRILMAIDVSGSMDGGVIAGVPGLTPRMGAAAMAMVTARSEKTWHCVGFSNATVPGAYSYGAGRSMHYGHNSCLTPLGISPRQRLDDVVRTMAAVPMGGTDCALPMLYAMAKDIEVDAFLVYTDSETWHGEVHPHQALSAYRAKSGIPAKLAVIGMVANKLTIADPSDAGMLDVIGFDAAAPNVLADFIGSG